MSKNEAYIGVDLGGTAIKYGLCTSNGTILEEGKRPTHSDAQSSLILEDIASAIEDLFTRAQKKSWLVKGIGIGTPGSVDVERGFLQGSTPNFKAWKDVPIREVLEKRFQLPVFVDNDANAMAYGEYLYGAGKGSSHVIAITLGTGIGGGVILDGQLFRGHRYVGAEVGHMSICYDGMKCRCGGIGCWELYASATAMVRNYNAQASSSPVQGSREIFERYKQGDLVATKVVEKEVQMVAAGVASLLHIFNPQVFIIGGGVSEAGEWFIQKIEHQLRQRTMPEALQNFQLTRASLGNKAGWLGAAALVQAYIHNTKGGNRG